MTRQLPSYRYPSFPLYACVCVVYTHKKLCMTGVDLKKLMCIVYSLDYFMVILYLLWHELYNQVNVHFGPPKINEMSK